MQPGIMQKIIAECGIQDNSEQHATFRITP